MINISKEIIFHGINNVITQTGINGRWQILSRSPLTICDIAHNVDGISHVVEQIKNTPGNDDRMAANEG